MAEYEWEALAETNTGFESADTSSPPPAAAYVSLKAKLEDSILNTVRSEPPWCVTDALCYK